MQTRVYHQTDSQLRAAIEKQIGQDPEVMSRDVSVIVREGVVALAGFVHHYYQKRAAGRAANSVAGVKGVANNIVVTVGSRTDPEIARDILQSLNDDLGVPKNQVRATVRDGFVILEGRVDWGYQRERAVAGASRTFGVRGVSSTIAVNGQDPAPESRNGSVSEHARRE